MNTIYALVDPRTGNIRYIGVTRMTLKQRMKQHRHAAANGGKWPLCYWVRKLTELGIEPIIESLETTEDRSRECYWIALYRQSGVKLLNATDGGDGHPGSKLPPRSEEHRRKISENNKGRVWTEETRTKYQASRKGLKASPKQTAHLESLSQKQQGRRYPPEVIERMRQAQQSIANSKRAKLTPDAVRSIRAESRMGNFTQTAIGRNHGVSRRTVGMILSGERWSHVI